MIAWWRFALVTVAGFASAFCIAHAAGGIGFAPWVVLYWCALDSCVRPRRLPS